MAALSLGFVAKAATVMLKLPAWNSATVVIRVKLQVVVVPAVMLPKAGVQLSIVAPALVTCKSLRATVPVFTTVTAAGQETEPPAAGSIHTA